MRARAILFAAASLLLIGAGGQARAAERLQPIRIETPRVDAGDLSKAPPANQFFIAPSPRKTVQLDTKGRWGLRLDMDQPTDRVDGWKDIQAGAYFRITPSLRVGGSVGVTDKLVSAPAIKPQDNTPRVHLETAFRF